MARPRAPQAPTHLVSARMVDVSGGRVVEPGNLLVDDGRIVAVSPSSVPAEAVPIDLGDATMLPGLMDMELNLFMGGPTMPVPWSRCRRIRP